MEGPQSPAPQRIEGLFGRLLVDGGAELRGDNLSLPDYIAASKIPVLKAATAAFGGYR